MVIMRSEKQIKLWSRSFHTHLISKAWGNFTTQLQIKLNHLQPLLDCPLNKKTKRTIRKLTENEIFRLKTYI